MASPPQPQFIKATIGRITFAKFTTPNLDYAHVEAVEEELNARLAEGDKQDTLYLDFSDVEYLSSNALGKLVGLNNRAARNGCRLVLTNLSPYLYELFCITHLDTLIDVRCLDANLVKVRLREGRLPLGESPEVRP